MEWVTFGIAIASFVMSAASWIHTFLTQRRKLGFTVFAAKSYADITYLYLLIENKSRLPIAITRIRLLQGPNATDCTPLPVMVSSTETKRGHEVIRRIEEYSTAMPIQLSSLGAMNSIILFEALPVLPPDDATHLILSISTNRGKSFQTTLELPAGWASHRNVP